MRTNQVRVNSTQQQVDRTQILLKAGSVAESNLLDIQSQLATDQLNVITAQNQETLARLQLAQYMNLDEAATETLQIVTPPLADPDETALADASPASVYETAQTRLPEIKAADLRVQSAMRTEEVARGAYYPRLFFGANVFTGYSSVYTRPIITGDSVTVPIPVFQIDPTNPLGSPPIPTALRAALDAGRAGAGVQRVF